MNQTTESDAVSHLAFSLAVTVMLLDLFYCRRQRPREARTDTAATSRGPQQTRCWSAGADTAAAPLSIGLTTVLLLCYYCVIFVTPDVAVPPALELMVTCVG